MKNEAFNHKSAPGKLLALDTSASSMSVALLEDGAVRKEINSFAERNHSIYVIPSVREAMAEIGWTSKDLQGIAVGRGPGSYTGVRIGITVAKTMAWALGIPVSGVSSMEAMAAGALDAWEGNLFRKAGEAIWLVPMLNARRGQVFTGLFMLKQGESAAADHPGSMAPVSDPGWSRLKEDGIRLMDKWTDELLELIRHSEESPAAVVFTGETEEFAAIIERFSQGAEELRDGGVLTATVSHAIQARYIGYLGALRLASGDEDDVHGLLPNYTQLTEAEVNLLKKIKG